MNPKLPLNLHRVFHGIRFKVNKRLIVATTINFFFALPSVYKNYKNYNSYNTLPND